MFESVPKIPPKSLFPPLLCLDNPYSLVLNLLPTAFFPPRPSFNPFRMNGGGGYPLILNFVEGWADGTPGNGFILQPVQDERIRTDNPAGEKAPVTLSLTGFAPAKESLYPRAGHLWPAPRRQKGQSQTRPRPVTLA